MPNQFLHTPIAATCLQQLGADLVPDLFPFSNSRVDFMTLAEDGAYCVGRNDCVGSVTR